MNQIINDKWIDAFDMTDEGLQIAYDLKKYGRDLNARIRTIQDLYSELMRTINLTEEDQVQAKIEAQKEILKLIGDVQELQGFLQVIQSQIQAFQPNLNELISDYDPTGYGYGYGYGSGGNLDYFALISSWE